MKELNIKDAIRWAILGDTKILQIKQMNPIYNKFLQIIDYDEFWIDVPCVFEELDEEIKENAE